MRLLTKDIWKRKHKRNERREFADCNDAESDDVIDDALRRLAKMPKFAFGNGPNLEFGH